MASLNRIHSGSWGFGCFLRHQRSNKLQKDTFLEILAIIIFILTCPMLLILVPRFLKDNFNFSLILFIYLRIWFLLNLGGKTQKGQHFWKSGSQRYLFTQDISAILAVSRLNFKINNFTFHLFLVVTFTTQKCCYNIILHYAATQVV